MRFDIALPNCMEGFLVPSQFAGPAEIIRFAQAAEGLGYDALWGFDFTTPTSLMHAPTSEETRIEAEGLRTPSAGPRHAHALRDPIDDYREDDHAHPALETPSEWRWSTARPVCTGSRDCGWSRRRSCRRL